MSEFFQSSVFFGTILTFLAYGVGLFFKKKLKLAVFNPILIAIVIVIGVLLGFGVDYPTYSQGAKFISSMITPATICLAVPLYERLSVLKKNYKAIIAGILSGVVTSLLNVWLFALMFGFTHAEYVTFLPKSITTAIGMGLSEELGGYGAITAAVIIITGILGNMIANCNRYIISCNGDGKGYGNGRNRGCSQQSFNSGCRLTYSSRCRGVCTVYINR